MVAFAALNVAPKELRMALSEPTAIYSKFFGIHGVRTVGERAIGTNRNEHTSCRLLV